MSYAPAVAPGVPVGAWTTGMCGCFEDCHSCCCAYFCPCVVVGRVAEIASDGFTDSCTACCLWFLLQSFLGCGCIYSQGFRSRLRQKYALPPKPCGDCLMHTFCLCCAITQEYRELKNRGWNPRLGFSENVRIFQARGQPPPPQAMFK